MRRAVRYCAAPAGRAAYSTAGPGPALLCDSGCITGPRRQLELYCFGMPWPAIEATLHAAAPGARPGRARQASARASTRA